MKSQTNSSVKPKVRARFLQLSKQRRYLQIEEVYEKMYPNKIQKMIEDATEGVEELHDILSDEEDWLTDNNDEDLPKKNPKKAAIMRKRRKIRKAAWMGESPEVKAKVTQEWDQQKGAFKAAINCVLDTALDAKTPADIQE